METAAIEAVVEGLKKSGVDFISLLPDSDFSELQARVANDKHFTYVPVSNEAIGVRVCAGAYLSRKKPALLVTEAAESRQFGRYGKSKPR
jgi:sulfopyruvate decarboxylase TPP-binding subunit